MKAKGRPIRGDSVSLGCLDLLRMYFWCALRDELLRPRIIRYKWHRRLRCLLWSTFLTMKVSVRTSTRIPRGVDTIGYGTSLKDGITEHEGKLLLISRLKSYIKDIGIAVPFFLDLPSPAQIVLIDLAYQVGTHGLLKYEDMLKALAKRDYETAAQEIENSKEAIETPHRARRLAAALRAI